MAKGLSEDELKALVASEMRSSLGYSSSKLSAARQKAEYYYLGLATGDLSPPEIDGRSGVVSTDVRDTIEAMLPQLMVTFCGGDQVVEFEPQGKDDEEKASVATEYVNYLFFKKNNGHQISYTWMKDALLQKNGIVKIWWDTRNEEKKEEYNALDQVDLAQIMDDPEVEVTEQKAYPDEDDAKQRQQAIEQLTQQLQQAMQAAQMNPQAAQAAQQIQQHIAQIQATPAVLLYDITCKRTKTEGKIAIDNVPPEEFLIARNAKNIQDAKFVGHRVQRTVSELKSMGYKNVDNISGEDQGQAVNSERIQRLSWNDENAYMSDEVNTSDPSQRRIWITECYVRVDFDGDGISELRKVTVAGNELLDNEEVDFTPFVSITPVPLPHTFFGLSIADLSMDMQKSKTSLLRAAHDNTYLEANGRYFAVEGQVNLDDLLTSRPGGVVRVKQPGAVGRLDQGAANRGAVMELLEYTEQELEKRTGWSRYSQGNDAKGLNDTATGINVITNKADMRLDLIARNFAEGFTELFKYILKLVCQHQNKKATVRLTGGWAEIDPREWRNQFDVSINVGIGLGNKDQKVQHLMALLMQQEKTLMLGVTNPENVYNAHAELVKLLGFKNPDKFFTDPVKNPPPPQPNPEQEKLQGQMQIAQATMQSTERIEQMKAQLQTQANEADRQHEAQLEHMKMGMQAQVDDNRQRAEAGQKTLEQQYQAQLSQLNAQYTAQNDASKQSLEKYKADLASQTTLAVAEMSAKTAADGTAAKAGKSDSDIAASVKQMWEEFTNQPITIVRDATGRASGVKRGNVTKNLVRGPDGKATGVQ
jgi:hypothetical protein